MTDLEKKLWPFFTFFEKTMKNLTLAGSYQLNRLLATVITTALGVGLGYASLYLPVDLTLRPALAVWISAALLFTVVVHEGIHGAVAAVFGHKPHFGLQLPFVYVTFKHTLPRHHFMAVALAPLIVLDAALFALLWHQILPTFVFFCLVINTLGATGDVWMFAKLVPHQRDSLVMDTKTGFEVWEDRTSRK